MQPIQGKTYQSTKDPSIKIYLEAVSFDEPDEDGGGYYVEACALEDKGDMSAPGIEMNDAEWTEFVAEHGLIALE